MCSTSPAPPPVPLILPTAHVIKQIEDPANGEEDDYKKHKHRHHSHHNTAKEESTSTSEVSGKSEDEEYVITLTESSTNFLISIVGTQMSNDAPNYNAIKTRNEAYQKVLDGRDHADNLQERHSQTVNFAQKTKSVQAVPCTTSSVGCQSTDWDIHDAYTGTGTEEEEVGQKNQKEAGRVDELVKLFTSALNAKDCLLDVNEASMSSSVATTKAAITSGDSDRGEEEKKDAETNSEMIISKKKNLGIMTSPELLKSLNLMERAVQQNLYHESHLRYRDYPLGQDAIIVPSDPGDGEVEVDSAEAKKAKGGASMSKLFTFQCNESKGRAATTMSWNRGNKDILAVGYGR